MPLDIGLECETVTVEGVIIRDGTEPGGSGCLEFDLPEVLAALGERVVKSRWKCPHLQYTSRDEQHVPILEQVGVLGAAVSGADLTSGIDRLMQVIDGVFEAFDDNDCCWVIIRAVDSSWWEVWSDDKLVLEAVRANFRVTERIPQNAGQQPLQPPTNHKR